MNHTPLWVAATIIALVVIIGFVLSVPHTSDVLEAHTLKSAVNIPSVMLRDTFKKGLHTITGSVEVPNACTTVSAEARIINGEASSTESILVAITMPTEEGTCLQLPQRAAFQTTISAAADVPITATINGMTATTSSP